MILIVTEPWSGAASAWPEHVLPIESPAAQLERALRNDLRSAGAQAAGFCLS
jgi:hypothetical protein